MKVMVFCTIRLSYEWPFPKSNCKSCRNFDAPISFIESLSQDSFQLPFSTGKLSKAPVSGHGSCHVKRRENALCTTSGNFASIFSG